MKTFRHAGDHGDIIWSLPVVRYLCGGELLYEATSYTREPMTPERWRGIEPLLWAQPYVGGCRPFSGIEKADVNLNDFRARYFGAMRSKTAPPRKSICEWILETHRVPLTEKDTAWLHVPEPLRHARVVINRSPRYHNPEFPWTAVFEKYVDDAVFIGPMEEYTMLLAVARRKIPRVETKNLLEAARVIAGADLFIGNQSCCYAIAEALKKPAVLEVCPWLPNCLFDRPGAIHGWNGGVLLPDLEAVVV